MISKIVYGEMLIIKSTFGQWLKQRRKSLDLTRDDLAARVGCAADTLYKFEVDERRPSKQIAELLAACLEIPVADRASFVRFARAEVADSDVPWGTAFHPPTNLFAPPTMLIGRDDEVSTIRKRLLQSELRMLTLMGAPGIGKTRLALQVAAAVLDDFADGVFFIPLAPITDANLVTTTIASTLGVPEVGPQTPLERLKAFLRDKQLLLILDNCEQILASAAQIASLLMGCPLLKLLVTSRAPLRIRPERQFQVSPLAIPDLAHLPDVETVTHYAAVALFVERAQAVNAEFMVTSDNAPTIAAICKRLDGLPLAIELISARIKLLPPAILLERLHGRLMLQSDGMSDLEPRHRTLNAAIDWSYQLLTAEEQTLFCRLGVFVSGWTLETVESVCMDNLTLTPLDALASLVDKNLVKQAVSSVGEPRFTLLETIREYALERLTTSGELVTTQRRHAATFVALAEIPAPASTGTQQGLWLDRLEIEHANFRAALTWFQTETDYANGLRLAVNLCPFWERRGHLAELNRWLTTMLTHPEVELRTRDYLLRRARALEWLGKIAQWQGNLDSAQLPYEESLTLYRELGDNVGLAETLGTYGMLFLVRGDYAQAAPLLEESLTLARELGNTFLIAQSLLFLGNLAYSQDQAQRAGVHWEESLSLFRALGNTWIMAILLTQLAMLSIDNNDYHQARAQLAEGLTLLRELGERWQTSHTLEVYACLAVAQRAQQADVQASLLRSARIFGAAQLLRETLAAPVLSFQRHFTELGIATLRDQLDETALTVAWAEGRAMTFEQIVAYALET